jgi:hypothetical protein
MTRAERRRLAVTAAVRYAHDDPLAYDEAADRGDLRDRIVAAVDDHLDREGAA